ncbi:TPA: hypothetical protein ACXRWX_000708 [Klebsiella variicola subsp. variicola]
MVATGHILYQGKEFLVQHAHFLIEVQYSAERAWTLCIGSTYALPYFRGITKTSRKSASILTGRPGKSGFILASSFREIKVKQADLASQNTQYHFDRKSRR